MNRLEESPFNQFLDIYGYRNARDVKAIGEWVDNEDLETPAGHDDLLYEVGQKVLTTEHGCMKPGLELEILEVDKTNGWARYFAGGMWHRQADLEAYRG